MATTVPIKQLTSSVSQAVTAALDRHKVAATAKFAIGPGLICGPLLEKAELNVAQQIANEVVAGVGGTALANRKPAVVSAHGHIICGVILDPQEVLRVE
jgi:hypothetical protein